MELGSAHGGGTAGSRVRRRDLERVCVCGGSITIIS